MLGAHGLDAQGRFVYKIMARDRIVLLYFGAAAIRCKDCLRWQRIRLLPKEKKAEFTPMHARPATGSDGVAAV